MSSPFWAAIRFLHGDRRRNVCQVSLLRVLHDSLVELQRGAGVPSLNARTIESIEVKLPNTDEQHAIATVLSDMDKEIAALEERRDKARAIKQGMMQVLLTGRVRLVEPESTSEQEARTVAALPGRCRGMSTVGQREARTQRRVVNFFSDALDYAYLGHWKHRVGTATSKRSCLPTGLSARVIVTR